MAASSEPDGKGSRPRVVVISGPTASGKSSLAIQMAIDCDAEIISADSRQIFCQLKIGTGRLSESEQKGIPHHLMGTVSLGERFTAFDFVRQSRLLIGQINERGKKVIICGGTGLYLRALIDGIFEIPDDDMSYRQELIDLAARSGSPVLHDMLARVDPDEAAAIHPNNLIKIIRALEIFHVAGRTKSELMKEKSSDNAACFLQIVLMPERQKLYKAIEMRVDQMIGDGLTAEAKTIFESPLRAALRNSKIVGYSELIDYFEGRYSLDTAIELIKQNTRRYAKRQYTWFRHIAKREVIPEFGRDAVASCRNLISAFWE